MEKTLYAEKVLATELGVSQALIRKAAKAVDADSADRILVECDGKKCAAYSVPGVRKVFRWLCCKKNAPKKAAELVDLRLGAVLAGAEVREGCLSSVRADSGGSWLLLPQPGGFPFPEKMELIVSPRNEGCKNRRLLLCRVAPEDRLSLSAAFRQRSIPIDSAILRVSIHSRDNFTVGMRVPVEWIEADYFQCTAKKMPRRRGRW